MLQSTLHDASLPFHTPPSILGLLPCPHPGNVKLHLVTKVQISFKEGCPGKDGHDEWHTHSKTVRHFSPVPTICLRWAVPFVMILYELIPQVS